MNNLRSFHMIFLLIVVVALIIFLRG